MLMLPLINDNKRERSDETFENVKKLSDCAIGSKCKSSDATSLNKVQVIISHYHSRIGTSTIVLQIRKCDVKCEHDDTTKSLYFNILYKPHN